MLYISMDLTIYTITAVMRKGQHEKCEVVDQDSFASTTSCLFSTLTSVCKVLWLLLTEPQMNQHSPPCLNKTPYSHSTTYRSTLPSLSKPTSLLPTQQHMNQHSPPCPNQTPYSVCQHPLLHIRASSHLFRCSTGISPWTCPFRSLYSSFYCN